MVLIIYMRTLSSNEKFWKLGLNFNGLYFLISVGLLFKVSYYGINSKTEAMFSRRTVLYEPSQLRSLRFLIVYLLLTLLCVVKLVKFEFGPLVKRL